MRFVVLAAVLAFAAAHQCTIYPPQRGGVPKNLNETANMMCALETGPCGGTVAGAPSAYIQAGQTWQFTIQKNLDHYNGNPSNPGVFEVNLSPDGGKTFLFVASFADDASPSGSIYTLDFSTPSFLTGVKNVVVQTVYKTNNQQAPAAFYQCADVQII